jgi:chaperonin GroES
MKYEALHEKVIVRRTEASTTPGGILIPETARRPNDRVMVAVVESVGSGRVLPNGQLVPPSVKVGDTVLAPRYQYRDNSGVERPADIEFKGEDGETRYVVREPDIYAVVTP